MDKMNNFENQKQQLCYLEKSLVIENAEFFFGHLIIIQSQNMRSCKAFQNLFFETTDNLVRNLLHKTNFSKSQGYN